MDEGKGVYDRCTVSYENPPFSQQMWQKGWEEAFDREWQAVALFL